MIKINKAHKPLILTILFILIMAIAGATFTLYDDMYVQENVTIGTNLSVPLIGLNGVWRSTWPSGGNTTLEMQNAINSSLKFYNIDVNYLDGQDGSYYDDYDSVGDIPTATPSNGDTTHLSTADHIFDYIVSLSYVANAWDALSDMTLAEDNVYVGNGIPVAVAMPDCDDSLGNHLNYDTGTNAFSCGTSDSYAAGDDAIPDCTAVNGCTIDAESMEGTDWGTMTNAKWCVYDSAGTEVDCNVNPVVNTDTNASTACNTNEYLDGDGNCVDVITEAELSDISELNTQITDATFYTVCGANQARVGNGCTDVLTETELNSLAELDTQIGISGSAGATTYWRGDNSWTVPPNTQLSETTVEAYIFDTDNTANLGMGGYDITNVDDITFTTDPTNHKIYDNATCLCMTGDTAEICVC